MAAPVRAALSALVVAAALAACGPAAPPPAPPDAALIPGFSARSATLERMQLVGAGNATLVTLRKLDGAWRVVERGDWPADPGQVARLLSELAAARRAEAKTARAELYSRLGVEPVSLPDAAGVELRLEGGGAPQRLLVGRDAGRIGGDFVRIDGAAQSWRSDRHLELPRDPLQWLDRRLVDRPLARIAEVEVRPAGSAPFRLVHRDDRFQVDGVRATAPDSHLGDTLAGGLDQLKLDDVAADDPAMRAERELRFVGVDGVVFSLQLWRIDGRVWARLSANLDEPRATAWIAQASHGQAATLAGLRAQVEQQRARFAGRRFLLPPLQAANLMLARSQILEGQS